MISYIAHAALDSKLRQYLCDGKCQLAENSEKLGLPKRYLQATFPCQILMLTTQREIEDELIPALNKRELIQLPVS